jgi:ribonuclease/clavin/mitogillin
MSLTGTNCFVVGSGATRVLIDACDLPEHNSQFLINFSKFLEDHPKVAIDKIFITHSHHDHIGGVEQVVGILKARKCETKIYKLMNAN